jgi:hypothetical protein
MFGTFMNVDYRESSTKMVNFYAGKPSEFVDIKDNADYLMDDDSFSITRGSNNPLAETQLNKNDHDKSNKVAGFNVDIGPQNQSIFYGFNVNQDNHQNTAEALEVINQMANQAGNRAVGTQNVSLYNLYKNRSYSCTISMMGNAMIQPTMYFNLRYVPMFSGPYMILDVTHSIKPGSFDTIISGIRQPVYSLPKIDLLIGGSPCQSFSFAGHRKGMSTKDSQEILTLDHYLQLKEEGCEFDGQSYLFWEYMRLLNEVKPKYFLLENVLMLIHIFLSINLKLKLTIVIFSFMVLKNNII